MAPTDAGLSISAWPTASAWKHAKHASSVIHSFVTFLPHAHTYTHTQCLTTDTDTNHTCNTQNAKPASITLPLVSDHQLGEGGPLLKLWVEGVSVGYPGKRNEESASSKLTPRECRERGLTYQGGLLVDLCYQVRRELHLYCCTHGFVLYIRRLHRRGWKEMGNGMLCTDDVSSASSFEPSSFSVQLTVGHVF